MDLSKPIIPQQEIPPSTLLPPNSHYHSTIISQTPINNKNTESVATTERIPTSTWGSFTIVVVVFLVLFTCFILNCSRIRRTVDGRRMDKLGRSGTFKKKSFERRHKELQEADLEWNDHPPMVYEEKLPTPESIHCSKHSSLSSSGWSSHSTLAAAQSHHYNDIHFIRNQPPGVQLRLTLENASSSSLIAEPNLAFVPSLVSSKSSSSAHRPYQTSLSASKNVSLPTSESKKPNKTSSSSSSSTS
ncbi:hypothetical protein MFLAVUS_004112 [Mucor flavus]|uniref:Uncharacterized protein n=1 Tax=Mucor flavus TaxID=439312 RepID=A0ABP9YUZ1_9FUNG